MFRRVFRRSTSYLSGTLYIGSQQVEVSLSYILGGKLDRLVRRELTKIGKTHCTAISTGDAAETQLGNNTLDYIFIDPPFGANLNYSELNFLWESWLKVWTNNKPEAIENSVAE